MYNVTNPTNKKLFFQGNSLLDTNLNHTVNNGKYITYTLYNNIKASYPGLSLIDYSISGQDQIQINSLMTQQFTSDIVKPNSVILIMEGTNNLSHYPSKTGAQAFSDLQIFITHISQFTNRYIICTTSARDVAGDPVDLMTRIDDYNILIRANYSGNQLLDLAANSNFWPRSAADSVVNYDDKLHWLQPNQDLFISLATTSIQNIL